jgi:hypothetical protein
MKFKLRKIDVCDFTFNIYILNLTRGLSLKQEHTV